MSGEGDASRSGTRPVAPSPVDPFRQEAPPDPTNPFPLSLCVRSVVDVFLHTRAPPSPSQSVCPPLALTSLYRVSSTEPVHPKLTADTLSSGILLLSRPVDPNSTRLRPGPSHTVLYSDLATRPPPPGSFSSRPGWQSGRKIIIRENT